MPQHISLTNLIPVHKRWFFSTAVARLLDKALGVSNMNRLYQRHHMAGLNKQDFAKKLIEILQIEINGTEPLQASIPAKGPLVIACNHPFGGIEGVILSLLISQVRPDLKVLANQGLKLFPELDEYFIYTNPLSPRDPANAASLRSCLRHVKNAGALLIFPAGRVAYYQKEKQRVSDHPWNRLVSKLIDSSNAAYLPLFVAGHNSQLFYLLGRVYYRFRLLMLARELLKKSNQTIRISTGNPFKASRFNKAATETANAQVCRLLSYAQDPDWRYRWPQSKQRQFCPLATPVAWQHIEGEIAKLPSAQQLFRQKDFDVYYAAGWQLPYTVFEISRLREWVFRQHNEGSGQPIDTDEFDHTYTHLFVINRKEQRVIGAYRMGQTDELLAKGGMKQLYLARMFHFSEDFVNRHQPCLEMGRSFLIPEYQRSFHGLYLLWRGIGAFVAQHPRYRTLYGTVSLSKLYDPRSVALIESALVSAHGQATPDMAFEFGLHPEIADFQRHQALAPHLSALLAGIEADGKGVPILIKHYIKLGAKFHCLGIDKHFNNTPGLLLSVDLAAAPDKQLKLYLGSQWQEYQHG